ncbi:flippase [Turicibacter sanguinis]|uniref:flippase n=1 Tax=Turicibacter sanguinis TaxID=154288 RepID=UPI00232BB407|nr:flippase [Turicibacter sanguinis]MDB8460405.1 flippase [Turicibacter sanguinis]
MSLKKNFIYNIMYQILIMILPLITAPYISRVIGAEGIGIYSYTYSIVNYFILFAMLGLNNYGNRSIAAVRDDKKILSKTFFEIYNLQLVTSISMVLLYVLYLFIGNYEDKNIASIQIIFIISTSLDINWFFFGLEQFKLTVTRNTVIKILTVIFIFIFVKDDTSLWLYTLIMAVGTLLSQVMLWAFVRRYVSFQIPTWKGVISHFRPNLVLFLPVIAISIYKIMDKIMLGSMTNMLEVGFYENSEKIINLPMGIITALGVVMLPRMTNLTANGNFDKAKQYIEISLKFIMFLAIGITIGLFAISSNFIPLFFGEQFKDSVPVVSILSFTVLFISWANVIRTQFLIPQKKDKIYIISTVLGAIINVVINLLLIPNYGAVGAAIGTIFAEASVAIYQTFNVRKELEINKYFKNSLVYVIPAIIMYLSIYSLGQLNLIAILLLIIQVIVGGMVYVILSAFMLFIFDRKIKEMILKRFR